MTSFSEDFPDTEILSVLGDDIKLIQIDNSSELIKGYFEREYNASSVGGIYDIQGEVAMITLQDSKKISNTTKINVFDVTYSELKQYPLDNGLILIHLGED